MLNCTAAGFFPDPHNCRAFWECSGDLAATHHLCPLDEAGTLEMFDLENSGCQAGDRVECGSRPVCDDCNQASIAPARTSSS